MEQLSRQLQTERNNLLQELKKYKPATEEKPAAEEPGPEEPVIEPKAAETNGDQHVNGEPAPAN